MTNDTFGLNQNERRRRDAPRGRRRHASTPRSRTRRSRARAARRSRPCRRPARRWISSSASPATATPSTTRTRTSSRSPRTSNFAAAGTVTFDINSNHFDSANAVQAQGGVFINAAHQHRERDRLLPQQHDRQLGRRQLGLERQRPRSRRRVERRRRPDDRHRQQPDVPVGRERRRLPARRPARRAAIRPTFNATVTNNTIAQPGPSRSRTTRRASSSTTAPLVGRELHHAASSSRATRSTARARAAGGDARFRQRFDTKVDLPGYTGAAGRHRGPPNVAQLHPGPEPDRPAERHVRQLYRGRRRLLQHPRRRGLPAPGF